MVFTCVGERVNAEGYLTLHMTRGAVCPSHVGAEHQTKFVLRVVVL